MARTFTLQARRGGDTVDFSAELNPEQLAVATAPGGPMLVIAGAGSGKTRALTYRLAWLVAHGIDPERILLVTFTNRAAREMLNRVELLLKRKTPQLWGGTFHHVANRILRLHGSNLGLTPDFTILDREDSRDLLGACVAESNVPIHQKRFPQKNVLGAISSFLQNTLAPLPDILAKRYPMFLDQEEPIRRVLDLYAARKKKNQLLDYDDYLTTHYENANLRREDLKAVADFSAQYRTCEAFLADVALAGEFSGETVVNGPDEMEFVTLSTVHQAKGLEWPVVLIPWLADGRFPTDMAINTAEDLEEERRVFHVAVTRAKDELYLVVPQIWSTRGHKRVLMKPSRFLMELSEDLTEKMVIEEGLPALTTGASPALPPADAVKVLPAPKAKSRRGRKKKGASPRQEKK